MLPGMEPVPAPPAGAWAAILFAAVFPTALTLAYFVALADRPRAVVQAVYAIGKVLQFGFPLAWWRWSTGSLPRPSWPSRRGAGAGLVFGLLTFAAAVALALLVLRPAGIFDGGAGDAVRAKVAAFGVSTPARFVALGVFYSVLHAAAEEYYWRWFVFGALLRARAGAPSGALAVLGSSAGFMAHHVVILGVFFGWRTPWTYALALAVGAGGAFWAWLYRRSGSLLGPWLGHLLVDAAIFTVGYGLVFG
jgi:hypothetical protein